MSSFPLPIPSGSPFPLENIPFGIFSPKNEEASKRAGTIVGDTVIDLALLEKKGLFANISKSFGKIFAQDALNHFADLGHEVRRKTREAIIILLSSADSALFKDLELSQKAFHPISIVQLYLPMQIPEFTDFSCFAEHIANCCNMGGMKFPENFYHSPLAYNGWTSSIISSGTNFHRPRGVFKDQSGTVTYQHTKNLDYEMEMGIFVSGDIPWGTTITSDQARDHIFGFVLLNDWSARDIQFFESNPAGPFNCKGFATSISPWVIVPEALEGAQAAPLGQTKENAPKHLEHADLSNTIYDIDFSTFIARNGKETTKVSTSNLKHSFFTPGQCLSHRVSAGSGIRNGGLLGSGTISSPESEHIDKALGRNGCLFELSVHGTQEVVKVGGGYLEDGDEVAMEAWAKGANGVPIGFGRLQTTILPPL